MQKLSNFTGQARHGWEKMTPAAFGMGRPHNENLATSQQQASQQQVKRSMASTPMSPLNGLDPSVSLSFNVPFASNLAGPEPEEVVHASPGAFARWTQPPGIPEGTPTHKLPVHVRNVEILRQKCKAMSESSGGRLEAAVTSSEPKPTPASQRLPRKGLITNVCLTGDGEFVHKMRARILNETPIVLVRLAPPPKTTASADKKQRSAIVHIDTKYVTDATTNNVRPNVLEHLDRIANYTGSELFLLRSKQADPDNISANYANGSDQSLEQRLRIAIYGDTESSEHAKMRVLIMIDQVVSSKV